MAQETNERHIAYIMTRFPRITETFILREMNTLTRLGWHITPLALIREREFMPHPGVETFLGHTSFAREHLPAMLWANLMSLARHPKRYLQLLRQTLWWCRRSPGMLVRSLLSFPVAISWSVLLKQQGIRHIHAHFATHAAYIAYIISRFSGVSYSFTAHAHDIYMDQTMLAEKIRRAAFVVPVSEFNRQRLIALCPAASGKIHVVYCGVDTTEFRPVDTQTAHGDVPATPFKIVCVARMQEYKGHRYLVEACKVLRNHEIDFHCTLIGDGPDRTAIQSGIERAGLRDAISFTGWLPSQQIAERLVKSDVLVLPSVVARNGMMEGLPNVLIEALSCGIPVVSTTLSGIPELVRSRQNGILVPPNDAVALADALAALAGDPVRRRAMGSAGRQLVVHEFDLDKNTLKKAQLFERCLLEDAITVQQDSVPTHPIAYAPSGRQKQANANPSITK